MELLACLPIQIGLSGIYTTDTERGEREKERERESKIERERERDREGRECIDHRNSASERQKY